MNIALGMIFIGISLLLAVIMAFTPYWTRKTESFGVTIPEEAYARSELKQLRKQYAMATWCFSILLGTLFFVVSFSFFDGNEQKNGILVAVFTVILCVLYFTLYLYFHRKMKVLKKTLRLGTDSQGQLVVNTQFRNEKLHYSNLWFGISFLIAIITFVLTFYYYDKIPDRMPMQYDFAGNVTTWAEKSYRSVLLMPVMQIFMIGVFAFVNTIISRSKQQISAANPEKSLQQNIIFRRRWSAFSIISGTMMVLMFTLGQMSFIFPSIEKFSMIFTFIVIALVVIGAIVLSITTGQGGSRVNVSTTEKNLTMADRDDDRYWKLGVFYFNPKDPAIFLEKRFGIGWTNNWAHPLSWIFIVLIIVLAAGIPLLLS